MSKKKYENESNRHLKLLSYNEIMELLGLSRPTLRRWMESGDFPKCIKLGPGTQGRVAWKIADIEAWIESSKVKE